MKIFLDVGCHQGQTIECLVEPVHAFGRVSCKYAFDKIYGFEPVAELQMRLAARFKDPRFTFYPFGLWKENCEKLLYSPASQSASIFPDKINVDLEQSELCTFVRASDWFRDNLNDSDEVYVKLNCEGCEVDIIEDLLDSNEYRKVTSLAVSFDVKKIPSQRQREFEIKKRLKAAEYTNYLDLDLLRPAPRRERIQMWLSTVSADGRTLNRLQHRTYLSRTFFARTFRYVKRKIKGYSRI
jgi:hypothetical protein